MKTRITLLLLFLGFYSSIYSQTTIVDYFLALPDNLILDITKTERQLILNERNQQKLWEQKCYFAIRVVDKPNAFLSFGTTGDGDGNNVEITYFVKKDKSRILAINITYWNVCCQFSTTRFYEIKGSEFIEITQNVIPKIGLDEFIRKQVYATILTQYSKTEMETKPPVKITLPQVGKTIKVELEMETLYYEFENEPKAVINDLKSGIYCHSFDLIWNDGTFSIANKK